jgi:phospho-N-acetylmuramoyl-pentapeptide-transferase
MLFHLFNSLREQIPGANVFRYVSTRMGLATLTSLLITFVVAPWFIRRARERQLGELIRDDGPAGHASKKGTPTMGGALIIMALSAGTVLWCDLRSTLVWLALLVTVGYGAIGCVDAVCSVIPWVASVPCAASARAVAQAIDRRSGRGSISKVFSF